MISDVFIERPRFALVISIVLTLAGALAVKTLPITQYPQVTPPQVSVETAIRGPTRVIWPTRSRFRWRRRSTAWTTCCTWPRTATIPATTI